MHLELKPPITAGHFVDHMSSCLHVLPVSSVHRATPLVLGGGGGGHHCGYFLFGVWGYHHTRAGIEGGVVYVKWMFVTCNVSCVALSFYMHNHHAYKGNDHGRTVGEHSI